MFVGSTPTRTTWGNAKLSYFLKRYPLNLIILPQIGHVAQLGAALDLGSKKCGFEFHRDHQDDAGLSYFKTCNLVFACNAKTNTQSNYFILKCGRGVVGKRDGLRCRWTKPRAGSNPVVRTDAQVA